MWCEAEHLFNRCARAADKMKNTSTHAPAIAIPVKPIIQKIIKYFFTTPPIKVLTLIEELQAPAAIIHVSIDSFLTNHPLFRVLLCKY